MTAHPFQARLVCETCGQVLAVGPAVTGEDDFLAGYGLGLLVERGDVVGRHQASGCAFRELSFQTLEPVIEPGAEARQ